MDVAVIDYIIQPYIDSMIHVENFQSTLHMIRKIRQGEGTIFSRDRECLYEKIILNTSNIRIVDPGGYCELCINDENNLHDIIFREHDEIHYDKYIVNNDNPDP